MAQRLNTALKWDRACADGQNPPAWKAYAIVGERDSGTNHATMLLETSFDAKIDGAVVLDFAP